MQTPVDPKAIRTHATIINKLTAVKTKGERYTLKQLVDYIIRSDCEAILIADTATPSNNPITITIRDDCFCLEPDTEQRRRDLDSAVTGGTTATNDPNGLPTYYVNIRKP